MSKNRADSARQNCVHWFETLSVKIILRHCNFRTTKMTVWFNVNSSVKGRQDSDKAGGQEIKSRISEYWGTRINGESTSMMWPTLGSGMAKEQEQNSSVKCRYQQKPKAVTTRDRTWRTHEWTSSEKWDRHKGRVECHTTGNVFNALQINEHHRV